jgi:hypothetical protein
MAAAIKKGSRAALLCLPFEQANPIFAVRYGDWRRSIAALLGRFLPKLRAARESGLFSWVFCFCNIG